MKYLKLIVLIAVFLFIRTQTISAQTSTELLERAKASIQAGKNEAAIQDLTEVIRSDSSNADAFGARAQAYLNLRNYPASLADSGRATAIAPNFGWAYYLHGMASLWQANTDFRSALADFTKVIALDPTLADEAYRFRAGIHNEFDKDYWAAVADANEAIRLDPNNGNSFAQRGWANTQLKNFEKARDDYRQAIKLNFATSGVYTTLGFNEFKLGDYDQAAIDTRKAIDLDSNNQDAKNNLANILAAQAERTKNIDKAADEFFEETKNALFRGEKTTVQPPADQKTKAKDPEGWGDELAKFVQESEDAMHLKGKELYGKGDYAGVLAYITPNKIGLADPESWELRAAANLKLGNYDAAIKDADAAIRSSFKKSSPYVLRGDIYKAKYSFVLAEADYRKALEFAPNDASIKQKLNSLNTAPVQKSASRTQSSSTPKTTVLTPKEEDTFLRDDPSAKAAYNFWDLQSYEDVHRNATDSIKIKPTAKMYALRAKATIELLDEDPMLYDLDDALKDINTSIELSSRDLDGKYLTQGNIYVGLKNLAKALESYIRSIEANPNSYPPYLERGKIYLAKGYEDWGKAVADLTKVIERDNTNTEAYNLRGYAYFRLDKKTESIADFKKVLALDPKDKYAKYNLNELTNNRRAVSAEEFKSVTKVYFV